uniref:Uncharacterized mitochondrial protein AtMg00810-like n=1 Tax=Tanacetum cinerariifolium TaxID=118510 RepID=A0A699IHY2_TANCI|nr:uncharacterized mitochondrial protein AtMg00810-like [Tanacetum cinerariifolium]
MLVYDTDIEDVIKEEVNLVEERECYQGQARKETEPIKDYNLLPLWIDDPPFFQDPKSSHDDGSKPLNNVNSTNNVNTVSSTVNATGINEDNKLPFDPNMLALEDVSIINFSSNDEDDGTVADMNNLDTTIQVSPIPTTRIHKDRPFDQVIGDLQSATQTRKMSKNLEQHGFVSTIQLKTNHKDLQNFLFSCFLSQEEPKKDYKIQDCKQTYGNSKALLKDKDGEEMDVHMYMSKIVSLMYLKGQLKLVHWYPKESPFDLVAYTNSDYAGASLDRKSTTGVCQFLGCRLISWQCKKQTMVANSTTEAKYVAPSSCCGQVL